MDLSSHKRLGDGINPRFDRDQYHKKNYKALQLCTQVFRAISLSLYEVGLSDFMVLEVLPAPYTSNLLVKLQGPEPLDKALELLDKAKKPLRIIVAQEITRRKAPDLTFSYIQKRIDSSEG